MCVFLSWKLPIRRTVPEVMTGWLWTSCFLPFLLSVFPPVISLLSFSLSFFFSSCYFPFSPCGCVSARWYQCGTHIHIYTNTTTLKRLQLRGAFSHNTAIWWPKWSNAAFWAFFFILLSIFHSLLNFFFVCSFSLFKLLLMLSMMPTYRKGTKLIEKAKKIEKIADSEFRSTPSIVYFSLFF